MNILLSKLSIFAFIWIISAQCLAESRSTGAEINIAGRQRMLTQNILKNYLSIGLNVRTKKSQSELVNNITLFETQLETLNIASPTSRSDRALRKVKRLWRPYKTLALSTITRDNAAAMIDTNRAILDACHDVVMAWHAYAQTESAEMVNIAGRQRMLSQRIALYYFAHAWGVQTDDLKKEFQIAKQEYGQGLSRLTQSSLNTPEINTSLRRVNAQWQLSTIGFDLLEDDNYVPHVIAVTTDGMLQQMEHITTLYEQLAQHPEVSIPYRAKVDATAISSAPPEAGQSRQSLPEK